MADLETCVACSICGKAIPPSEAVFTRDMRKVFCFQCSRNLVCFVCGERISYDDAYVNTDVSGVQRVSCLDCAGETMYDGKEIERQGRRKGCESF